ncbi:MAG TPA: hypothetical protein PKD09_16995 [Aggregatilinea sp.]|uniref:hypothetical protein n=1 Tax=Aggregatilinea sp. TaxID=2806333 RepID=UPI002B6D9008|nr:hypothetical protein [Aggregatilinea sp.]HML23355.1 hypothetical protein [Aggregatilinea sp.]
MLDEDDVFNRLLAVDWNSTGRRLVAAAYKYASRYGWHSGDLSILGKGNQPDDIAQTVIEKLLSGKRKWDPTQVELEIWLDGQVRSEIDNLYNNSGHKSERTITSMTLDNDEEHYQDDIEFDAHDASNPEVELIRKEYIEERDAAISRAIDGDQELESLIEAIIQIGSAKPQELSAALDKPIKEIYNLVRKLRRRLESQVQK